MSTNFENWILLKVASDFGYTPQEVYDEAQVLDLLHRFGLKRHEVELFCIDLSSGCSGFYKQPNGKYQPMSMLRWKRKRARLMKPYTFRWKLAGVLRNIADWIWLGDER